MWKFVLLLLLAVIYRKAMDKISLYYICKCRYLWAAKSIDPLLVNPKYVTVVTLYIPDIVVTTVTNLKLIWLQPFQMKKVNKQCLLDTPRTVRVSEKTWLVTVQTSRP